MPADVTLFARLAREAGVQTVVFMGQRIAEYADTGSELTNDVRRSYDILRQSGLPVIYFAPGYFADNVFVVSEFVLQLGLLPNVFGKGRNPWIATGDMVRSIVALLENPAPYYGQTLFPTGPESIGTAAIAAIFSEVLGRKIRTMNTPEWMFLKSGMMIGKEYGFDQYAIVQGSFYNRQMQLGRFDIAPTNVVKTLTGREPQDFEAITRDWFSKSPYRQVTLRSRLKSLLRFNQLPFVAVPGYKERMAINQGLA